MKGMKIVIVLVLMITFSICLGGVETGTDFELMLQKAYKHGTLRVILNLDIPDIIKLTKASTSIRTGDTSPMARQAGFNADLELEKGISSVSDKILYKLNNSDYRIVRRYSTIPFMALSVSPEALLQIRSMNEVKSVSEDKLIPLPKVNNLIPEDDVPGKPLLSQSTEIVGATKAWGFGITGAGWYIAVLDTGIRPTHEMFTGKDIVEACYSAERDCPNGASSMIGPGSAKHYYELEYLNGYDHGTHVSGIAAGNNGKGKAGVSKDSDIIAVQVFSYFPSEDDILSWSSDQLKGLEYVYSLRNTYNIASVNISIGGGEYGSFCNGGSYDTAIRNLKNVGIATVIASGNEYYCNGVSHPACYEMAIATGATTKSDIMVGFSNWKKGMVDLFGPGYSINSSIAGSDTLYSSWNGTSMAAPHVAGAWGLLKQMDMNMSVDKALGLLKDHGLMVNSSCSSGGSAARIDVGESIQSLLDVAPPLNFAGERRENRALLQVEYFNELTWAQNPYNASKGNNIIEYQIFQIKDSQFEHLYTVDSNTFVYRHRKISKSEDYIYAVKAITYDGKESIPAYVTVKGSDE
ncbi:MAG: S8 family serine peptidase [Candidatus Aminicenantes bacterium]|nr:S8 family serine peptidase [Candidatus Aminicenantes bacterium]